MTEVPGEASATESATTKPVDRKLGQKIGLVTAALLLVAGLVVAVYALATNPPIAATVRDITIIVLALSTILIGLSLVVLILQLQSLIGLLRDEIRPILGSATQTARTVRGTTAFLSDSLVRPVISVASYTSGIRQVLRLLMGGHKHSLRAEAHKTQDWTDIK
ncbi:MAG TPA: hypothetical protein PKO09_15455 [Anaerolineae bacterium]|nr:hypothetical protein [Anaerolineae bacterium]